MRSTKKFEQITERKVEVVDRDFDRCSFYTSGHRCEFSGNLSFDPRVHAATKWYCRFHYGIIGGDEYSFDEFKKWHDSHIERVKAIISHVIKRYGSNGENIVHNLKYDDPFNRHADAVWRKLTGDREIVTDSKTSPSERAKVIYGLAEALKMEATDGTS